MLRDTSPPQGPSQRSSSSTGSGNMKSPPTVSSSSSLPSYPMPAYLNFCPGGISFTPPPPTPSSLSAPSVASTSTAAFPQSFYYDLASYSLTTSTNISGGSSSNHSATTTTAANASLSSSLSSSQRSTQRRKLQSPDVLVAQAKLADDRLRQYALLFHHHQQQQEIQPTTTTTTTTTTTPSASTASSLPFYLPSLSVLANAAFGRLTGVPPPAAKAWADSMVLQYYDDTRQEETIPETEEDIYQQKPMAQPPSSSLSSSSSTSTADSTAQVLKHLYQQQQQQHSGDGGMGAQSPLKRNRPCGYVFQRGDIAWNCRTCQTDPTCVICDECFRHSNHDGHEVYFHRTQPGGCCDCGDSEAWHVQGCCDKHRPTSTDETTEVATTEGSTWEEIVEEALRMSKKGLEEAVESLKSPELALPPKLLAALGVVIGAAVNCLVQGVDGAGIGADPVQWKMRWSDEVCRISNGASTDEEYYLTGAQRTKAALTPKSFLTPSATTPEPFPQGYKLQLRLHNDDVHTFEEVIDALHEPRQLALRGTPNETAFTQPPLVSLRESANEMTQHVDSDGQVIVKSYTAMSGAMQGYRRLKSRGLHCAVVPTSQVDLESRARALALWLTELCAAHPAAAVLVVHALVQIRDDRPLGGVYVWREPRTIPSWVGVVSVDQPVGVVVLDEVQLCRRRFTAFPPHLVSSYVTREEAEKLHEKGMALHPNCLVEVTGTDLEFYSHVPYRLSPERYRKSPHALWGTLPSLYTDITPPHQLHPFLYNHFSGDRFDPVVAANVTNQLTETVYVVDTDLRKQQETDRITSSVFSHRLPGLHMISGVGMVTPAMVSKTRPPLPAPMEWRHLLATSSYRAPVSPVIILLLMDPYPSKQLRSVIHALFLSLLTDSRFKCRFAAAVGAVAYRPLSTLFCAGVGTEADTPLGFTVQILTAGSLVRVLGSPPAAEVLLREDCVTEDVGEATVGVFTLPIGHSVVRCIHTNLLGATKEVHMILTNTATGNNDDSNDDLNTLGNGSLLPALTYMAGEHPLTTLLPAAPDDGFLDSRSTRHKRLRHLLRDLEYIIETPGTALRLLLPQRYSMQPTMSISSRGEEVLAFAAVWARLLRLGQGMDPQKRKISGGHVEYEQSRWVEAFELSLIFAGTRDALAECPTNNSSTVLAPFSNDGAHLICIREAMGNVFGALLRELKLWLFREGMLETGLLLPAGNTLGAMDLSQIEVLQRSTLHVSSSQLIPSDISAAGNSNVNAVALSCATGVKMTEAQLELIENAMRLEGTHRQHRADFALAMQQESAIGPVMADWLRVPHSPLAGDSLSFHLPLHRALAKSIRSMCSVVVPLSIRNANPSGWWKLPVLDEAAASAQDATMKSNPQHPLVSLIRPSLRSSNCRVVWSSGPECSPVEAQRRRSRAKSVSANIAVAKIIHSLADHPLRCLAAAQQIERHLWARNGSSIASMALNYSSSPLCRGFRDLDLTLVQTSAAGFSVGLGARRVFALLISRFSMDGYLCDPERRFPAGAQGPSSTVPHSQTFSGWVNPPRLQDPEHATILSESFFATLCVLVTELPPPPPLSPTDDSGLRQTMRRELLHALIAEPRSHSEAMSAASGAVSRRDEADGTLGSDGGAALFKKVFTEVLQEIAKQKSPGSARSSSGPAAFELKPECCEGYDPSFFHLRRQEHQHAMDNVVRLRKQKWGADKEARPDFHCLPLVSSPPKAHPRFLPCRLLLHLASMDAALRRYLLFAVTGGSWLPPTQPEAKMPEALDESNPPEMDTSGGANTGRPFRVSSMDVPTFGPRGYHRQSSSGASFSKKSVTENDSPSPFSPEVVAGSSVSLLEVLQLLTLQVHTLEECAALHRTHPDLDDEAKALSAGLSVNSYLSRLIWLPESLEDIWALRPFPEGPLPSKGSGEKRGSMLGLLITLYEHKSDHADGNGDGPESSAGQNDGHGGARALATSALKWLLRFVNALIDGAPSVSAATKCATTGTPYAGAVSSTFFGSDSSASSWTIDATVRSTISSMLAGLPDLWPRKREVSNFMVAEDKSNTKTKDARKAAQLRVIEMMKQKQKAFAATIAPVEAASGEKVEALKDDESDLCIICKCDDADGENNGPLGYLGHVQRSRSAQMRASNEGLQIAREGFQNYKLFLTYRVVGHRGCQLRESESMDSKPSVCLPRGSIVTVLRRAVTDSHDIASRRVFVRHTSNDVATGAEKSFEGWASVQSAQGYVILSPLVSLCYTNARWGSTRPIIKQCGHAAHLKCVETHTLSLHQRAASDQPYDGRFAANIQDGEFLCPLCKQLSNILIPQDGRARDEDDLQPTPSQPLRESRSLRQLLTNGTRKKNWFHGEMDKKALGDFGGHLLQAMDVPWKRVNAARNKKQQRRWHHAIQRWDYEEEDGSQVDTIQNSSVTVSAKCVMRLLRQQHVAWAAFGHTAAACESSSRAMEEILPFGAMSRTTDPWAEYNEVTKDSHPSMLELKRTLAGVAGLLEYVIDEVTEQLSASSFPNSGNSVSILCGCIADIIEGRSWLEALKDHESNPSKKEVLGQWVLLTSLMTAIPCHVARDGMLSQRHEARAVAAAMWAIRGVGTSEVSPSEPPVPLAVSELCLSSEQSCILPPNWGTMNPFVTDLDAGDSLSSPPFRPGVASAFLYTPLLAWDLCTLASAFFSSMLLNASNELPRSEDLLHTAQTLLLGRMMQCIVTPTGLILSDDMDVGDDEGAWSNDELARERSALVKVVSNCRSVVVSGASKAGSESPHEINISDPAVLFSATSSAMLPFARSLILMLRACNAVIRQRQRRTSPDLVTVSPADKTLEKVLYSSDLMSSEDGFRFMKEFGGPLPSFIIDQSSAWGSLVDRWLIAVVGWDLHHGSSGKTLLPNTFSVPPSRASESPMVVSEPNLSLSPVPHEGMVDDGSQSLDMSRPHDTRESIDLQPDENADDPHEEVNDANMEVDESDQIPNPSAASIHFLEADGTAIDELDDSEEELIEDMEMDDAEMVGFADQGLGDFGFGIARHSPSSDVPEDSSDESCSSDSRAGSDEEKHLAFANVGRSPILPYQPSLLGLHAVGPGRKDIAFEVKTASAVMSDLSHLGLVHRKDVPTFSLIRLPKSFVELYGLVNKVKGRDYTTGFDDSDDAGNTETAICLLTGEVMRAGSLRRNRATRRAGACTIHARKNGSGIGIFFLVQKCTVLLMHNSKSAYSPSIYVDEHGEEDPGLRRGRPLFLNDARYRSLEMLWRQQGIPREVAQIRSTSDRVIRDDWY